MGGGGKGYGGYGKGKPQPIFNPVVAAPQPRYPKGNGKKGGSWGEEDPWQKQSWGKPKANTWEKENDWKRQDDGNAPQVLALHLTQASQLTQQGFPPDAPCLAYDKLKTIFSNGHAILQEIVEDISAEVEIHHDTEWEIFPEVAEAIKAAGGEETCFGVATCPNQGKWAVGLASGWKGRECSAKLALAFALLSEKPAYELEAFCKNYPEFRDVMVDAGILPPRGGKKRPQAQNLSNGGSQDSWSGGGGGGGGGSWSAGASPFPTTVWATLPPGASLVMDGLPSEGPCVYHEKPSADLYSTGHAILREVLGPDSLEVDITHDPDWDVMPEVAEAIKKAGGEENCYAVATLKSRGIWGVGIAGGWKPRESACKLALCLALVSGGDEDGICKKFPDFAAYFNARGPSMAMPTGEPAQKRQRSEPQAPAFPKQTPKAAGGKAWPGGKAGGKFNGKGGKGYGGGKRSGFSRDVPLWLQLPTDQFLPPMLQDLGHDAIAIATDSACGGGVELYDMVDGVLGQLMANPEADVVFIDDPKLQEFPEVSTALKTHGNHEEPLTVASCSSLGAWGVGIGHTPQSREAGAKLALAAMLTLKAAESGDVPDLETFPAFSEFVATVEPPS